jgi:hypothetical protein
VEGVPIDEFYCWFTFLFDCYFLVDLDGGEGTGVGGGGWTRAVGEGVVCVNVWRERKVVVKVIVIRSHRGRCCRSIDGQRDA